MILNVHSWSHIPSISCIYITSISQLCCASSLKAVYQFKYKPFCSCGWKQTIRESTRIQVYVRKMEEQPLSLTTAVPSRSTMHYGISVPSCLYFHAISFLDQMYDISICWRIHCSKDLLKQKGYPFRKIIIVLTAAI